MPLYTLFLVALLQACTGDTKDDEQKVVTKDSVVKLTIPIDRDDAQFALQAANSNLDEIDLGKLAIKRAVDKRVKNFGAMMIKDHEKADDKLYIIAKNKKITLPNFTDSAVQKHITDLSQYSGRAFDRAYLNDVIRDHESNIKLFHKASKDLMDADLRGYATKNLRVYQRHLDAMNIIRASLKE